MVDIEIWEEVQWNPKYKVSNLGRVRSKYRILKTPPNKKGYAYVCMRPKHPSVHRMVASAFIPNPGGLPCVNHIDGNKLNNRIDNLEWVSKADNREHARVNGLMAHGENHFNAKLNTEKVKSIRSEYEKKYGALTYLARKYGVARKTIKSVVLNETWTH